LSFESRRGAGLATDWHSVMRPHGAKSRPGQQTRRFEVLLFFPWALGTLLFSIHVLGAHLFLVYVYGWQRVNSEHLRILKMPKGADWPVSNGDMIREGFFVHYLITLFCWLAMFLATYPLLRLLLPASKRPVA
jgi:hypothetical protein